MLDTYGRKYTEKFISGGAKFFGKLGLKPTHVTVLAAVIGVAGAVLVPFNVPIIIPVLILWISGYLDSVDGSLARLTGHTSPVGTLLDIFLDRVVELAYIFALAVLKPQASFALMLLCGSIVLSMTAFLTSGNLLKNTGVKTFRYQIGLLERTEGFIFTTAMMIFNSYVAVIGIIYAALVTFTAVQRVVLAILELKSYEKDENKK